MSVNAGRFLAVFMAMSFTKEVKPVVVADTCESCLATIVPKRVSYTT